LGSVSKVNYFISFLLTPVSYALFTTGTAIYSRRFSGELKYKILMAYFFVAFIFALKALVQETSGLEIYNRLCIVTSIGLSFYFFQLMSTSSQKRIVVLLALVQIVYHVLSNFILADTTSIFDSMAYVILSTGMVVMIFLYVVQLLNNVTDEPLSMSFDFWFVAGQLIYFLGSFLIFLTFDYLTRKISPSHQLTDSHQLMLVWLWGVHNVLLFLSSLLTVGSVLWIAYHKKLPSL
jgi:hypothetical protein